MSRKEELKDVIAIAQRMTSAYSCCPELKEATAAWIDSIGTAEEKKSAKNFIEEVKADITNIDNLVAFAHSDHAKEIFGDKAAAFAAHADELKNSDAKYCDCPACTASLELLEHEEKILNC